MISSTAASFDAVSDPLARVGRGFLETTLEHVSLRFGLNPELVEHRVATLEGVAGSGTVATCQVGGHEHAIGALGPWLDGQHALGEIVGLVQASRGQPELPRPGVRMERADPKA